MFSLFLSFNFANLGYLYIQISFLIFHNSSFSRNISLETPVPFPFQYFPCFLDFLIFSGFFRQPLDNCLICPFFAPIIHSEARLCWCSCFILVPSRFHSIWPPLKVQISRLSVCWFRSFLLYLIFGPKSFHQIVWALFNLIANSVDFVLFSANAVCHRLNAEIGFLSHCHHRTFCRPLEFSWAASFSSSLAPGARYHPLICR